MRTFSKKKLLLDYSKTIINTISIEKSFYSQYGFEPKDFANLPRPDKWISKLKPYRRPLLPILKCFYILYKFGLVHLYFVLQFIYWFTFLIKKRERKILEGETVLAFSNLTIQLLHYNDLKVKPKVFILFPWVKYNILPKSRYNFENLIELKDLVRALNLALKSISTKKLSNSKHLFQTYTAFKWFLVRIFIDRLNNSLIISNHTDRWAVLSDQSIFAKRRNGLNLNLTIIQHGKIVFPKNNVMDKYNLGYRLKSVTRLYCHNLESKDFFCREILSLERENEIEFLFFSPKILLTELSDNSVFRILFVGHPVCENIQIQLYHSLRSLKHSIFYYKPHPTVKPNKKLKEIGWQIMLSSNCYPLVDLVISYDSTLALEYSNIDIPVIYHDHDSKDSYSIIYQIDRIKSIHDEWSKFRD